MPTTLYNSLLTLLIRQPLTWTGSEYDYGVQAVRLSKAEMKAGKWQLYEADAFPSFLQIVNRDCEEENCPCQVPNSRNGFGIPYRSCPRNCVKKAWNELEELMDTGEDMVSFTRPNDALKATDLILVVHEGGFYTGIQTVVVNT